MKFLPKCILHTGKTQCLVALEAQKGTIPETKNNRNTFCYQRSYQETTHTNRRIGIKLSVTEKNTHKMIIVLVHFVIKGRSGDHYQQTQPTNDRNRMELSD